MSQPYIPWYFLAKQLPERKGLDKWFEALGGRSEKIISPEARWSVQYRFYDKSGNLVATRVSEAWRWVCHQHGITKPLLEDMPQEAV